MYYFPRVLRRLSKLVSPPTVVGEIDWINRHWPEDLPEDSDYSKPQVSPSSTHGNRKVLGSNPSWILIFSGSSWQ